MSSKTRGPTLEQLESLKGAILNKPPYCSGVILGRLTHLQIDFSNASDMQLQRLAEACDVATFGMNEQEVSDESYRKAGKLDAPDFCTNFDIYDSGLIQIIRDDLLEGDKVNDDIRPELYKINVYGPGGFFKAHKDTPRSEKMFGSLVLVFPTVHKGGALILRDEKQEWTYDSAQALTECDDLGIGYVAFYSDVEHEVAEVKSSYRVTLTYNLYNEPSLIFEHAVTSTAVANFKQALEAVLADPDFLPEDGYLGFGLRRAYPLDKKKQSLDYLVDCLKGSDAVLMQACTELSLDAAPNILFKEKYFTTLCHVMPSIDGKHIDTENGIAQYLKKRYGAKYIAVRGFYSKFEKPDLRIRWVTEMTKYTKLSSTYEAYGNQPSVGYAYGYACLVVHIGPGGSRQTIGDGRGKRKAPIEDKEGRQAEWSAKKVKADQLEVERLIKIGGEEMAAEKKAPEGFWDRF